MAIPIALVLDRSGSETLTAQLLAQLRDAIRLGRLPTGSRLPSSRQLADQLGIARNTAVRTYDILSMEGYVEARPASGLYVALPPLPVVALAAGGGRRGGPVPASGAPAPRPTPQRPAFDFVPDQPAAALFPLSGWRRQLRACLAQGGTTGFVEPGDPGGLPSLRAALATYLATARGIAADAGRILVTGGAAEGIALAARLLVQPGTAVVLEAPGPPRAAAIYAAAGARLVAVPVDREGLVAAALPAEPGAVLHLTPSHQDPTGHSLSPARRRQVLAWAERQGAWLVEDDRGSEFRYEGGQTPALAAAAPERSILLGDVARSLGPGIRLGYAALPAGLLQAAQAARLRSGQSGPSWLEQAALAEFLAGGGYAAHLARARSAYRARRDQLVASLGRHFGAVELSGTEAGLHLFWQLPPGVPDAATVAEIARRARVGVYPLPGPLAMAEEVDGAGPSGLPGLRRRVLLLGYGGLTPRQIEQGIARLSDALDDALDGQRVRPGDLLSDRPTGALSGALPSPRPGAGAAAASRPSARRSREPAPRPAPAPALSAGRPATPAFQGPAGAAATGKVGNVAGWVEALYRYPIKGLSAQQQEVVAVEEGRPFPFDRIFALARPGGAVTPEDPKWAKKGMFVMLMLDEGLASVATHLDEATLQLQARAADGRILLSADLGTAGGRAATERFFHHLAPGLPRPPALVRARDGHFMDKPDGVISLINLATLRELEGRWGQRLDPLRFRANIYIDGVPPWAEFDWIGREVALGMARFRVDRRNGRCSAINVDPATGRRDLDIPGTLRRAFGHKDLGVYLVALSAARLQVGDRLAAPGVPAAGPPAIAPAPALAEFSPAAQRYICGGCYLVYDETRGVPALGVPPGTPFAALPARWTCPDCGVGRDRYRPHRPPDAGHGGAGAPSGTV